MQKFERAFHMLERPFAWLDYDALDFNIKFVNDVATKPVRIATKSIRSVTILKYIQSKLKNCVGFMTYTAAESVYLLEQGLDDLLLGYPTYETKSIEKLLHYSRTGKNITFMVDAVEQIVLLQQCAEKINTVANICLDINVSTDFKWLYFGTKRSPLNTIEKLIDFVEEIMQFPNICIRGVMGYEAQIAGIPDLQKATNKKLRIKGFLIRKLKGKSLQKVTSFRQFAIAHVKSVTPLSFVNGGGSGSIDFTCQQPEVTEVTVGSAFFAPVLFDDYESLNILPAVGFALRVTRQFDDSTFVCHGGGYVASGAAGADRLPVFLNKEYTFLPLEGPGEVQTPFRAPSGTLKIGDTVYLRHAKAGELCERFNTLQSVRGTKFQGPILTYRGDQQCFL
ncbi:alanine racemase [Solibacillus sp. CAU 1738]|uniref:alanine racemase n=1 Tax=Solibacillus sp. CAU 1738 TaxID=3140363 RepID=UPI00326152E1